MQFTNYKTDTGQNKIILIATTHVQNFSVLKKTYQQKNHSLELEEENLFSTSN